jgi:hypothetical protein
MTGRSVAGRWLRRPPMGAGLGLGLVLIVVVQTILAATSAARWWQLGSAVLISLAAVGVELVTLTRRRLASPVLRSKARARLIVELLLGFLLLGLFEKAQAVPEKAMAIVNSEGRTTTIGVYVADAAAKLSVELEVSRHGDPSEGPGELAYDVFLTSSIATRVLIVTTTPQLRDPLDTITPRFTPVPLGWGIQDYAAEYAIPAGRRYNLRFFKVPKGDITEAHGRISAHLPMLTSDVLDTQYYGDNEVKPAAKYITRGQAGKMTLLSGDGASQSPQDSSQPSGAGRSFYAPATFAVRESFLGLGAVLPNYTVAFNSPSNGTPSQQDYVWTGTSGLSPYLYATENSIIEDKSTAAFLSGIFFGAAAAALLALVQELKDDAWPKQSPKRSSGVDAVTTSAILKEFRDTRP